jgi:hypothetical protein
MPGWVFPPAACDACLLDNSACVYARVCTRHPGLSATVFSSVAGLSPFRGSQAKELLYSGIANKYSGS